MSPEDVIERVKAAGRIALSEDEIAALEAAPDSLVNAKMILGAHYFNTGDNARAAALTKVVYERAPTDTTAVNVISALMRCGRLEEALAFTRDKPRGMSDVSHASFMAELTGKLERFEENRDWARRALALKEAEAIVLEDRPEAITRPFDMTRPERNVIAYSLFGRDARYLDGAIRNAVVVRHLYPGWTPRFYVDDDLPDAVRKRLSREGAQLRAVPNLPAARFGLYWRFLVEDDPEVDHYLVRDVDSVPTIREAVAVKDWLKSNRPFHVMRDYTSHCELVLAGMWGAHRGNVHGIGRKIMAFEKARRHLVNSRVEDQLFLRREIWPWMRGRVFVQDRSFGYGASAPFDPDFPLPWPMHIGQDDFTARRNARKRRALAARGLTRQAGANGAAGDSDA